MKSQVIKKKCVVKTGWLCRDKQKDPFEGRYVVFFATEDDNIVVLNKYWVVINSKTKEEVLCPTYTWSASEWKAQYDFKLLRPGTKIFVQIEI